MMTKTMAARVLRGVLLAWVAIASACAPIVPPVETPAPATLVGSTPTARPSPAATPSPIPPLVADTSDFPDRTALLDAVCYEFLATLAGETWVWTSQDDLDAFSERVAESELCPDVPLLTFDFDRSVLAGAVSAATGCDAAHRVLGLARDDATESGARAVTLRLAWETRPGCEYELLEPILVEVPGPPEGNALRVEVGGAG